MRSHHRGVMSSWSQSWRQSEAHNGSWIGHMCSRPRSRGWPRLAPMLTTRRPQAATPLVPPVALMERLPLTDRAADFVAHTRQAIVDILQGQDDRLVVVVGPCSIHDPFAAIEYAYRLKIIAEQL